jgi:hypothetical protein
MRYFTCVLIALCIPSTALLFGGKAATPPADETYGRPTAGQPPALPVLDLMSRLSSGWTRIWPRGNIRR